jgi:flagellar M-ring protein FliF
LGELAKSAVGFDAARGDQFQITSEVFAQSSGAAVSKPVNFFTTPVAKIGAGALAALLVAGALIVFAMRRKKAKQEVEKEVALLKPGTSVAELERAIEDAQPLVEGAIAERPALADPNVVTRDRARELAMQDPERAALMLKAWIQSDLEEQAEQQESRRAAS